MTSLPPLPAPPPGSGDVPPVAPPSPDDDRPARWPIAVAIAALLAVAVVGVALISWVGDAPADCEPGTFASARFGYCTRVPSGWVATAASSGDAADLFAQPSAAGSILVTAVPVSAGQDLERFADYVRKLDTDAGAILEPSQPAKVAGIDAVTFDLAVGAQDDATRSREVVFVQDGYAWRVQLADGSSSFEESGRSLDEMLAAWVFV